MERKGWDHSRERRDVSPSSLTQKRSCILSSIYHSLSMMTMQWRSIAPIWRHSSILSWTYHIIERMDGNEGKKECISSSSPSLFRLSILSSTIEWMREKYNKIHSFNLQPQYNLNMQFERFNSSLILFPPFIASSTCQCVRSLVSTRLLSFFFPFKNWLLPMMEGFTVEMLFSAFPINHREGPIFYKFLLFNWSETISNTTIKSARNWKLWCKRMLEKTWRVFQWSCELNELNMMRAILSSRGSPLFQRMTEGRKFLCNELSFTGFLLDENTHNLTTHCVWNGKMGLETRSEDENKKRKGNCRARL